MSSFVDLLNWCRRLYREGEYQRALGIGRQALEELDHIGPSASDASDLEYGLDGATLVGLIYRGLGDDAAAWSTLSGIFSRRCPGLVDPTEVIAGFRDDERQRNIIFGQMMLFELGVEHLLELPALRYQLRWCGAMARACRVPMLKLHLEYLEAWMARVEGRPREAIERWLDHCLRAERALAHTMMPAGYPPARSLCQAALTAEALGDEDELEDIMHRVRRLRNPLRSWELAVLLGIEARHGASSSPTTDRFPAPNGDAELERLRAESWLWGQADGDDGTGLERVQLRVGNSPPAVVVGVVARVARCPQRFSDTTRLVARRWFESAMNDRCLAFPRDRRPLHWNTLTQLPGAELARFLVI